MYTEVFKPMTSSQVTSSGVKGGHPHDQRALHDEFKLLEFYVYIPDKENTYSYINQIVWDDTPSSSCAPADPDTTARQL
jgi:hypothetical protein